MNHRRIATIARKEWREIVRDRLFVLLAFLLPVLLMLVFGYGLTQDVENMPLAVVDEDRTTASREYARRYIEAPQFAFRGYLDGLHDADRLLAYGAVRVVLVIGSGFERQVREGRTAAVQVLIDGTFINTARVVKGYVDAISGGAALTLQSQQTAQRLGVTAERAEMLVHPLRIETRYFYNQELRSVWAVAPALVMNILMWTAPLIVALTIVREKETGSIYSIYASETTRLEFLTAKLLPCTFIGFVNALVLWALATLWFGAPFRGNPWTFIAAALVYVLSTNALGLLISLWVRTQQAALMLVVLLGAVLAMHFSGMFEPVVSLPLLNRLIAHMFPAMYFNNVVQATFLKGAGFAETWPDIAATGLFAAAALAVSYFSFRKRTSS